MSSPRPPRFPNETAWLAQFDQNDLPIAEALLDTILFVPQSEFVRWVSTALINLHTVLGAPLAVFAVREPSGAYFPKHKGRRPTAVVNKSVGSEGVVSQRVERLAKARKGLYSHPCLATLKQNRIHDIALVDDTIGSGDTVLKFLANMNEHPTFKSWASRHYLRFWVVSYVATEHGRTAVVNALAPGRRGRKTHAWVPGNQPRSFREVQRHHPRLYPERTIDFRYKTDAPSYDQRVYDLAGRYGRRFGLWYPFGYGRGFTLVAYDHGCPNNAPGILWESRGPWKPLFGGRAVSIPSGSSIASAVPFGGAAGVLSADARFVLGELARGTRYPSRVARSTGIPRVRVLQCFAELREAGLLSQSNRLLAQDADLRPLLPGRRMPQDVTGEGSTYLPSQLRGASDAF